VGCCWTNVCHWVHVLCDIRGRQATCPLWSLPISCTWTSGMPNRSNICKELHKFHYTRVTHQINVSKENDDERRHRHTSASDKLGREFLYVADVKEILMFLRAGVDGRREKYTTINVCIPPSRVMMMVQIILKRNGGACIYHLKSCCACVANPNLRPNRAKIRSGLTLLPMTPRVNQPCDHSGM